MEGETTVPAKKTPTRPKKAGNKKPPAKPAATAKKPVAGKAETPQADTPPPKGKDPATALQEHTAALRAHTTELALHRKALMDHAAETRALVKDGIPIAIDDTDPLAVKVVSFEVDDETETNNDNNTLQNPEEDLMKTEDITALSTAIAGALQPVLVEVSGAAGQKLDGLSSGQAEIAEQVADNAAKLVSANAKLDAAMAKLGIEAPSPPAGEESEETLLEKIGTPQGVRQIAFTATVTLIGLGAGILVGKAVYGSSETDAVVEGEETDADNVVEPEEFRHMG